MTTSPFAPSSFDSHVQRFLDSMKPSSQAVAKIGLRHFHNYLQQPRTDPPQPYQPPPKFTGQTAWGFVLAVHNDRKLDLEQMQYVEVDVLKNFVQYLVKIGADVEPRPWTGKTVNCYFTPVTALASKYRVEISSEGLGLPSSNVTYGKHAWTIEEIAEYVNSMKYLKYQTLFVCLFQSGLSIGDMLARLYGNVKKEFEAGVSPLCLAPEHSHINREKTDVPFVSVVGDVSVQLLRKYLKTRGPLQDTDPLFNLDQGSAEDYYARHAREVFGEFEGMNPYRVHGLRDVFFKFGMKGGCPDRSFLEHMAGHKVKGDIKKKYETMSNDEWRSIYRIFEPALTFKVEAAEQ